MTSRHILIAGGGIGGLAAALSIAGQGLQVSLFEQADEFGEVGAGIQLSPNATRVLFDMGLEAPIRAMAFAPEGSEIRNWSTGKVISSSTMGSALEQVFGYPYLHIHRADLVAVLADAARLSDRIELHLGDPVSGFTQSAEGVDVTWRGDSYQGDVLIGADGIRSNVRELLHGNDSPRFTGNIAWRALVPRSDLGDLEIPPVAGLWWGPGAHFVHYFLRGGEMLNCVCVVEEKDWCEESWVLPGDLSEMRSAFSGWHDTIGGIIDRMDPRTVFKWALNDRDPMSAWRQGRVSLLGDACHPSLPFLAQGAAMAIEDGAVLARCLGMSLPVESCLQRYEDRRMQRTRFVQEGARRNARVYHMSGLPTVFRNLFAGAAAAGTMKKLFSYDALGAHL